LNLPSDTPTVDQAPILHVDLDAFFASVEILDDPTLRGRPVAVGGDGERGVIASASYEARRFGVRSAMASVVARRRCPDLIILPGRFDRYEEYSRRFHRIVLDVTPDFEALGLDEVFADLRSLRRLKVEPLEAAGELRRRINDELGLLCGVGLGRNKLFAKIASKRSKPTVVEGRLVDGPGVVWVSPELESQWLRELPVVALWGVGPATVTKLEKLGLRWVRDLAKVDEDTLARHVGASMAATLVDYARGEDRREVESHRVGKSVGHEETFAKSIATLDELVQVAKGQCAVVARALRAHHRVARTVSIVVRFDDLTSVTRSQTLPFGVDDEYAIAAIAQALLASVELRQSVRLFGVHASSFLERTENQMQLSFGLEARAEDARGQAEVTSRERQVENEALRDVVDEIRQKFGESALASVAELREQGVEITKQRGRHAVGPEVGDQSES
jgi:DNA polymerase-4